MRRGDDASVRAWLPSLLQVTHREADEPKVLSQNAGDVPIVGELTQLWEHFSFAA